MIFQRIIDFSQSTIKILNENFELVQRKLNEGFNGTTDIKPGTVTGTSIKDGAIDSLKIGTGEITTALIRDLSADSAKIHDLVVQTIVAGDITTKKLTVGDAFIDNLAVNEAFIEKLEVKAANIKDLTFEKGEGGQLILDQSHIKIASIDGAIIEEGTINSVQIADASITDAKILELTADKIKTGTLDAELIRVVNLHADSITTGKLQIVGTNLITNSMFNQDSTGGYFGWTGFNGTTAYTVKAEDGNVVVLNKPGNDGSFNGISLYTKNQPIEPNEDYIFSIEYGTENIFEDQVAGVNIFFQDKDKQYIPGAVERLYFNPEEAGVYKRDSIKFKAPENAYYFGIDIGGTTRQFIGFKKPMFIKGMLDMPYTPKVSELIQQSELEGKTIVAESITGEKIAANSIKANHIITNELKAAIININEAFINSAHIINIDASKITTGSMVADRIKGGTLELGGVTGGKMLMLDRDGEEVGRWDATNGEFSILNVGEIRASNIDIHQERRIIYVNSSTGNDSNSGSSSNPLKSIMAALNSIGKELLNDVDINISGTFTEDLLINSFKGFGWLNLNFQSGAVLNGSIKANNNSCLVQILGDSTTNLKLNHNKSGYIVTTWCSNYVLLRYAIINGTGNNTTGGVYSAYGGQTVVRDSSINNVGGWAGALNASGLGRLSSWNTKGSNNTTSVYAELGGIVSLGGSGRPAGKIYKSADSLVLNESCPEVAGDGSSVQTPVTTKTYSASAFKSYRNSDGWSKSQVYQGSYSGATNMNYRGCYILPASQIRTDFAGKTAKSITLTIKRGNSGGVSGGVSVNLYGSTYASGTGEPAATKSYGVVGTASRNQTITVNIPNAVLTDILNSNINSLMLYHSNGSNYSIYDNTFSLKIEA